MLADWVLTAAPGFDGEEDGDHKFQALPPRMTEDFAVDALEALEAAINFAPNLLAAVREARAWREAIAPTQQQGNRGVGRSGGEQQQQQHQQRRSVPKISSPTHASHLLGLVGCCPSGELEVAFPSLARDLLTLLRPQQQRLGGSGGSGETAAATASRDDGQNDSTTRAVALAALDEAVRRLLHNAAGALPASGGSVGGKGSGRGGGENSKVGGGVEAGGGGRQAVIGVLPKLVPAVTACLEGSTSADGASSVPPPPAVAAGALGVLEALVFLLRSTMRPHVKKVEAATALWLQGPSDIIRDRAAAVLASLPLCGEAEAWTQAAGSVALEAHGLLHAAWPDNDVDMGSSDSMSTTQLDAVLSSGGGLLPPLGDGTGEGFSGPQQMLASLVSRRFKGLCRVLELMLVGDSNGRPVAVPVVLILALVERVQRMATSVAKGHGPQAFIPAAQGALSLGALQLIRPDLGLAASRLLHALATTEASTVLRNARRFCRALVQGMARPSAFGSIRAAGYRSVSRATLQLGEGAAPYLATPALPALLAEVRAVVAASDPDTSKTTSESDGIVIVEAAPPGELVGGGGGGAGGGGKRGMGIEPAMSARKSSQKKQRRSREKEVGRALAAADAAATATAASNGGVVGGGGAVWTGAAVLAEQEAVCAGLSCLAQVVVCCKGHLPLGGRLAVEDVLHRGLGLLAYAGGAVGGGTGGGSGGGARTAGGVGRGRGCSRLDDPHVAREFLGLAHACLMTPLADGTRSGCLSIAIAAFRSFSSHPDQQLAAASQRALAGCGALLYPRATPLHLPHAVTSQARAWGGSASPIDGDGHGWPLGWGDTFIGAEGAGDEESEDEVGEGHHPERGGGVGGRASLSVQAAELTTKSLLLPTTVAPVVTPPTSTQTLALGAGSGEASTGGESVLGEGTGKGKASERATGSGGGGKDGSTSSASSSTGTIATSPSRKSSRESPGTRATTATVAREEDGHDVNQAAAQRKRPRIEADEDHGDGDAMDDEEEEEAVALQASGAEVKQARELRQQAPTAAAAFEGERGSGNDEDDDGFEFPAIVDADPDDE